MTDHEQLSGGRTSRRSPAGSSPRRRCSTSAAATGSCLRYLTGTRRVTGYGIEIDDDNVLACVKNGVNVIQSDLERGLQGFDAGSFDYVILSQTLQAMRRTEAIVLEMLRVGRQAIVTFPNFGHWRARWQVAFGGRMPVSDSLPYQWYDTPNVHLCTISDFERFCADHSVRILERIVLTRRAAGQRSFRTSSAAWRCSGSRSGTERAG